MPLALATLTTGETLDADRARPALPRRGLIIGLAGFSGLSALAGGVELLAVGAGSDWIPNALLAHTPFRTFLVPGLLLALVVGGSSLACALLAQRRSPAATDATVLAGGTLVVWLLAELALLRQLHPLHVVYGAVGGSLLWLGVRAAWRSGSLRRRWIVAVTAAEALGYLAPACAGIFATKAGLAAGSKLAVLAAAGLVEGFALGAGQAWSFPFALRRLRYALYTALSAALVWSSVMSVPLLAGALHGSPPLLVVPLAAALGLLALGSIGGAQWLELRHHCRDASRWIAWTALAWLLALPLSFTPAPFVDESTPVAAHVVLWGCGGLLMALVMALITWSGARRLVPR